MSVLPLSELISQPFSGLQDEPGWLSQQRQQAAELLQRIGLPADGSENWRYSSLRAILKKPLQEQVGLEISEQQLFSQTGLQASDYRMVFANGCYQPQLSLVPAGIKISNLASQLHTAELEAILTPLPSAKDRGFSWLNTAAFVDGLFIQLATEQVLDVPLHLIQLYGGNVMVNSRHIVSLGEAAKMTLIEQSIEITDMPAAKGLFNSQFDLQLGSNARLDWSRLQALSTAATLVDRIDSKLAENSHLHTTQLDIGGLWVRHDVDVCLSGAGGFAEVDGVVIVRGRQHCDVHTKITHEAESCISRETFKCIADDRARGVFNGKILVQPGADGTDSAQRSDNLLLSEHARIDTKPDLEILTDDVIASHGATVGQLDEDSLFYLRTRGIDLPSARKLLMRAFCQQVVELVTDEYARTTMSTKLDEVFSSMDKHS